MGGCGGNGGRDRRDQSSGRSERAKLDALGLCNAGEALVAAGVIERYFGSPFIVDRLRHVLELLGAAVLAAALSGIGGTLGFIL
jgi:hypothetical protein